MDETQITTLFELIKKAKVQVPRRAGKEERSCNRREYRCRNERFHPRRNDARGYSVFSRRGAYTLRLDMDSLGPQQDRHYGGFDLAFGLRAAAQPQPGLGRDDRAGLAP